MVLKKRIKVNPWGSYEERYRLAAAICPICGTDIWKEAEAVVLRGPLLPSKILYVAERRKITFFCPMCGCSWSVKQFKNSKSKKKQ